MKMRGPILWAWLVLSLTAFIVTPLVHLSTYTHRKEKDELKRVALTSELLLCKAQHTATAIELGDKWVELNTCREDHEWELAQVYPVCEAP
jgi:hypothetical protein